MTCADCTAQLDAYVAGTLDTSASEAIEAHAAECEACAAAIDRATANRLPAFAPPLPPELRAPVLQAVAAREQRARASRWGRVAAIAGAAALLLLVARPTAKRAQTVLADSSSVPRVNATSTAPTADASARTEFQALDDAERELQSALSQAPNDPQLSAFLQSVSARRSELQRRVKDAL